VFVDVSRCIAQTRLAGVDNVSGETLQATAIDLVQQQLLRVVGFDNTSRSPRVERLGASER